MESSAAKQQPKAGDSMITAEQAYLRTELEHRRDRLHSAVHSPSGDASLSQLLTAVDAALDRMEHGTFGICETCHDTIEPDRLLADPLVQFCLEHLTRDEQRALESDLSLAAQIQRRLLPEPGLAPTGWQVRYHYQPAGMVSGDYCDLLETDDGLLFMLGDVSGKGVAASMLMSHLHATFRSLTEAGLPLDRMVEHSRGGTSPARWFRGICQRRPFASASHSRRRGHVKGFNGSAIRDVLYNALSAAPADPRRRGKLVPVHRRTERSTKSGWRRVRPCTG
jgi:hypothetical protein